MCEIVSEKKTSQLSMREIGSWIAPPANEPPEGLVLKAPYGNLVELDGGDHPKYSDSGKWAEATNNNYYYYLPQKPESPRPEPTYCSSQSSPCFSQFPLKAKVDRNIGPPTPRGILVKRSVSEEALNKEHTLESSQYRQSSLPLCHGSDNFQSFAERSEESFRDILPRPSMHAAPVAAVRTQPAALAQHTLRSMNPEWREEREAASALIPAFEPANPRRTVSFAPVHQTRQSSIPGKRALTTAVRYQNVSFRGGLPRVLQAGIRPDELERAAGCPDPTAHTPRQLALWEQEELGAGGYEQGGHCELPLGRTEETQIHVKILVEKMREIVTRETPSNPDVLDQATPGYVAAMRRQHYADAYTSFRRPGRGLSKDSG
jgi:hypothetical protein